MDKRSRYVLAALAALLGVAMLLWPFFGQLFMLAVWSLSWLIGAIVWGYERKRAHDRDPETFSGWRGKTRLAFETAAVYGVVIAGVVAISYIG
ncbi:hypothetical protein E1281_25625 [Actinomadura sp. KC345]|uniref:hypothetical protein n=1 Tax=Actinomadura sp. KC345 TaxID=2530371 RepID=UPI00104EE67D|nr:hypothetical protein [Actinomadura sp. KC345]TDC47865.1 hypothetical protein E1281_25625 [Actinomadura sp. KC345]